MSTRSSGGIIELHSPQPANVDDATDGLSDDPEWVMFEHGVIGGFVSEALHSAQQFREGMNLED